MKVCVLVFIKNKKQNNKTPSKHANILECKENTFFLSNCYKQPSRNKSKDDTTKQQREGLGKVGPHNKPKKREGQEEEEEEEDT